MRHRLVLPILLAFVTLRALATASRAAEPSKGREEGKARGSGAVLERLSRELKLTDDQKGKIKPILEEESKKLKALRDDNSLAQDKKNQKMLEIHKKTVADVRKHLNPEQKKKLEGIIKARGKRKAGNRGKDKGKAASR